MQGAGLLGQLPDDTTQKFDFGLCLHILIIVVDVCDGNSLTLSYLRSVVDNDRSHKHVSLWVLEVILVPFGNHLAQDSYVMTVFPASACRKFRNESLG